MRGNGKRDTSSMRRRVRSGLNKRILSLFLAAAMLFSSADLTALATEPGVGVETAETTETPEQSEENQEEDTETPGSAEEETKTPETAEEGEETPGDSDEATGEDEENAGEAEETPGEEEDAQTPGEEMPAEILGEAVNTVYSTEELLAMEPKDRLAAMSSEGDVASGIDNDIVWVIDANGKLTAVGMGDYSTNLDTPWMYRGESIYTAEITISGITSTQTMFFGCTNLSSLDVKGLDTSQVTDMEGMFWGCSSLRSLDISGFDTSRVTDMASMFNGCRSLDSLDVSGFDTGQVTNMYQMFNGCNSLRNLDVSGFDTSQVTDMGRMFGNCRSLSNLDVSGFDTRQVTNMSFMFNECRSLNSLDISGLDTGQVTNMDQMFYECRSLSSLDVSGFNTSWVTDMVSMFNGCSNLSSLDVSGFDTSRVTNMASMFWACENLSSLDVSGFDTSRVTDMLAMFSGCSNLSSLDVSGFDTSRVTDMTAMFSGCSNLSSLDVSGFDTSQVTDMSDMFNGCRSLDSLDVSGFDTSRVRYMSSMFQACESLSSLDLSGFDSGQVIYVVYMFYDCSSLKTIYTPCNLEIGVELPGDRYDTWYRSDGTVVTTLPTDLSYSVTLGKNYIPNDLPVDIVQEGITINHKGYAQASFILKNNKGVIQKEKDLAYRFDDGIYTIAHSDKNGLVTVRSKRLDCLSGEIFRIQTKDMILYYSPGKQEKLNYGVTMKGSVTPLSFTQTWEMGVTGTLSGSIGQSAGVHAGVAEAEAELTKAEISGTEGGTLSIVHTYENGFRNLTLLQNYNAEIAAKAKIGPAASAGVLGEDIELEVAAAGAGVAAGASTGIGLTLENYDPTNTDQLTELGKFLLASEAQMKGNLALLCLAEWIGNDQYYNLEQHGVNVSVEADAAVGNLSFGGFADGSLASAEAEGIINYTQTKNRTDASKEYVFGCEFGANAGTGEIFNPGLQDHLLSASASGKVELGAEIDGNNQMQGFSVTKEGQFGIDDGIANAVKVSYGRDTVEQLGTNIGVVKNFIGGSTHYVLGDAQQELFEKLDTTPLKGAYSATVIDQECKNFELGLGANAVVGLDLSVGIEGVSSCEYEVEGGSYESGKRQVTNINEIKEEVEKKSYTLDGLVKEPLEVIAEEIKGFLTDKFGKFGEKVENKWAKFEKFVSDNVDKGSDWWIHIVALVKKDGRSAEPVSYAITAYKTEQPFTVADSAEYEYKVYTVGDPYFVYVTDDAGNEIPDYSANPLTLTLGYSNEMLAAAGLDETQVNNIAVYMYSEEVYGYVCIGGTANVENREVSVEITKPGQYILAADDAAPVIKRITVSKDTNKPVIMVEFQESSGFQEFSLKLDDEEVVGTANWKTYYNKAYNAVSYKVKKELAVGRHVCSVYAVDTAGNAMAAPYEMYFFVGMEPGDVSDDDIPSDGVIPDGLWIAGVNENGYSYTGKAIKPEVRVYDHTRLLVEKVDYTIAYKNNTKANDASVEKTAPTITVTGKGNYSGKDTKTFKILPLDISQSTEDNLFEADDMAVVFNKKAQKPVPALLWNGKKLKNKTDYTFTYHKGTYNGTETEELVSVTDAGEYYITLTGKGNFAGTRRIKLTVLPAATDEASVKLISKTTVVKIPNQSYLALRDNGQVTPEVTVKDGKTTLTKDVHYTVSYSNNNKVGTAYAIITGREEGGYSGTKRVSFNITGVSISKATVQGLSGQTFTYNGADIKPQLMLTVNLNGVSTELKEGTDYSVQWTKVSDAGTAAVVFTGINGYTGSLKKTYKIKAYDIAQNQNSSFKAELKSASVPYAKGGAKPELNVTFRKADGSVISLKEGKDYTVTYRNNTAYNDGSNANKRAYVTVKGKGNFSGTYAEKLYYQITAQDIGKMTLTAEDKAYQNKKNYYATKVIVTDLDGKVLKAGTDYDKNLTYTYRDDTNLDNGVLRKAGESVDKNDVIPAGTVIKVTATLKGRNYTGTSVSGEYSVKPGSISGASVSIPKQTYTGRAITLKKEDITVKVKGKKLEPSQYEIVSGSYQNNVKKGTATVTIRGIDNYGGTKKVKFTIKAKGFLWWWKKGA